MGTDNDPVVIAQRLLNLYRQLHIFSAEKKDAYNKMLMEQPPEVKRTLGSLPGGVVVQQYLADIEQEAGIRSESFDSDDSNVVQNYSSNNYDNNYSDADISTAGGANVVKGIVDAFKEVIKTSEKHRKEDTKELAQTIVALQGSMMDRQVVTPEGVIVNSNEPKLDDIITGISRAQSELIKELAHAQTQELSQLISSVLKEIQQMSVKTFIDALQTAHADNLNVFKNQMTSGVSMMPMSSGLSDTVYNATTDFSVSEPVSLDDYDDDSNLPLDLDDKNDFVFDNQEEPEEPQITETLQNDIPSDAIENTDDNTSEEYEWEYVEEEQVETYQDEYSYSANAEDTTSTDEEYEWEYVEEDTSLSSSQEEYIYTDSSDNNLSDEEYEWEYVEEETPFEETSEPVPEASDVDTKNNLEPIIDPYNPQASQDENLDNPLLSNNDNIVFNEETATEESISLSDDFGLSSNDDISELAR